jgi:hypothetical protein
VYYRKGHYKKSRLNKLNDTVSVVVYNPKTNTTYGTHISVKDTLMAYNSNDNIMLSYTSKDLGTHTINNYKAYGIKYIFDYKAKFYLGGQEKSKQAYYFSKDFPIHYKSQKDGFYNEIMQENPFLILKVIDNDFYIKVETKMAVKVERMKINKNMFLVDSSLPVKSI